MSEKRTGVIDVDNRRIENLLIELIEAGVLLPIEVGGGEECCEHGYRQPGEPACPSMGLCISDRFAHFTPAGSDCNRAERWMMRPHDDFMTDRVLEAFRLDRPDDWRHPKTGHSGDCGCVSCSRDY